MFSFETSKRTKRRPPPPPNTTASYQTSLSAQKIGENNDLLTQILVCLPIKSILKFKCVSKHWLSIITNPQFSRLLNLRPKPFSGFFWKPYLSRFSYSNYDYEYINLNDSKPYKPPFKSISFYDHPSDIQILQSCNGLFLCCCTCCPDQLQRNYYVYNPTTKQSTMLPPLTLPHGQYRHLRLAFDPSKSLHYKVISVHSTDASPDRCQIEIYSSETGPWRLLSPSLSFPNGMTRQNGVYWNGAIHWLSYTDEAPCFYFDIKNEEMREVQLPPFTEEFYETAIRRLYHLEESRGHLHYIDICGLQYLRFRVYELKTDYSGWFTKYYVDLSAIAVVYPQIVRSENDGEELYCYAFHVMCIVREEVDEESYLVLQIPRVIIRYNFKDCSFQKLRDLAPSYDDVFNDSEYTSEYSIGGSANDSIFQFMESLTCV